MIYAPQFEIKLSGDTIPMMQLSRNWSLDHVGHAVRDLPQALQYYQEILGFQVECRETLEKEGVEVVFLKLANTLIEIIAPLGGNRSLNSFLEKRGEGLHHICYRVPSVSSELQRLTTVGIRLVDDKPRQGSRGLYVAFVHPSSSHGILVELCSEMP